MVITDRLLVNVGKRQDYALTIATGTLAFLAVIVIVLMSFRYVLAPTHWLLLTHWLQKLILERNWI